MDMDRMKKIGRTMSVCMGITLSFFLSLVGNLMGSRQSGGFSVPGFILSFVLSTIVSLIIGFLVPMKKISDGFLKKHNLKQGELKARCAESLISDLIYTPVITLLMVALAYFMAMKQSGGMAQLHFLPMFLSSLIVCLIVGFILIFIFMPLFLKLIMKRNGG